ncbi:MAG: hypothetical protein F7C32_03290 [Desulfurococcales archaeon]|nr:hypothetical protein [Desulfurococcales archaeon]
MSRSGISPVIATVIIVAVAIAISIAVAGWLLGFWNVTSTEKSEGIYFYYDTYYNSTEGALYLHIFTHLRPEATITKVEVTGTNVTGIDVYSIVDGDAYVASDGIHVRVGSDVWLRVTTSPVIPAGSMVHYKVYTANGFVYWSDCLSKS